MKNIHVLPTDKPSRVRIGNNGNFVIGLTQNATVSKNDSYTNQNIYITNSEEIKEGDWYLTNKNTLCKCIRTDNKYVYSLEGGSSTNCKKIILTTDQDLDGVQAIDDEFLEWFVKNPSCERVEVEVKRNKWLEFEEKKSFVYIYKIIIPSKDDLKIGDNTNFGIITDINEKSVCFGKNKVGVDVWYKKSYVVKFPNLVLEEPKQETLTNDIDSHSWGFENFEVIKTEEDAKIFVETMENIPEPNDKLKKAFKDFNKQETTLEEVAERFSKQFLNNGDNSEFEAQAALLGVKFGAKWQAERMYSEKDLVNLLNFVSKEYNIGNGIGWFHSHESIEEISSVEVLGKWFEQFKKK